MRQVNVHALQSGGGGGGYSGAKPQCLVYPPDSFVTFKPEQNGQHFADNIFKCILMNEKYCILIKISLKFVPKWASQHWVRWWFSNVQEASLWLNHRQSCDSVWVSQAALSECEEKNTPRSVLEPVEYQWLINLVNDAYMSQEIRPS